MTKTMRIKLQIDSILNKFCFSERHDFRCNGCIFKNLKKCPVCGQKVVVEIKGDAKHGWYLCSKCVFCGWINDGENYA